MNPVLFQRLIISAAVILAGLSAFLLLNRIILKRVGQKAHLLPGIEPNKPAILLFSTPDCAPCHTIQRPAIQQVVGMYGEKLQFIEVDAYQYPSLARIWSVLSVPTTFLLGPDGRALRVNHGVTRSDTLLDQLAREGIRVD
jgi:thiol-disulfide isomerase/thioredoxin